MPHRTSFSKLFFVAHEKERISNRGQSSAFLVVRIGKKTRHRCALHRAPARTKFRPKRASRVVHAHHPTTPRHKHARDFPVEIALKRRDRERETKKRASGEDRGARERKHTTRAKHTHVDVNSSASLRTGRSNTLKSKFKDVIDAMCAFF